MAKRRTVVIVIVIGCHCFAYLFFIHGVSWNETLVDFLAAPTDTNETYLAQDQNDSLIVKSSSPGPKAFADPSLKIVNPHPYIFIINQPHLCDDLKNFTVSAIILVCSAVQNFEERQTIRETWGQDASPSKNTPARLAFLLGSAFDSTLQSKVQSEAEVHRDIIQEDFHDTYFNLTLKSVMLLKWVTNYCESARYVLKTDDDMYVNIPNFLKVSSQLRFRDNVIYGSLFRGVRPNRNSNHKWHIPYSQYPGKVVPDYVSGTAYAMTADVAPRLYNTSLHVPFIQMEDIYITGVCASKADVKRINHHGFTYLSRATTGCAFKSAVTGHHVNKNGKRKIWKELQEIHTKKLDCPSKKRKRRTL